MKIRIVIDKTKDEEVLVYAHERNELVNEIEKLVCQSATEIIGYKNNEAVKLSLHSVNCFICEDGKTFALAKDKLQVKLRLYQVEDMLDENFIKINQSCVANIRQIEKVQATLSGALFVVFKNGYRDYISRRNLKSVKERLGVKL